MSGDAAAMSGDGGAILGGAGGGGGPGDGDGGSGQGFFGRLGAAVSQGASRLADAAGEKALEAAIVARTQLQGSGHPAGAASADGGTKVDDGSAWVVPPTLRRGGKATVVGRDPKATIDAFSGEVLALLTRRLTVPELVGGCALLLALFAHSWVSAWGGVVGDWTSGPTPDDRDDDGSGASIHAGMATSNDFFVLLRTLLLAACAGAALFAIEAVAVSIIASPLQIQGRPPPPQARPSLTALRTTVVWLIEPSLLTGMLLSTTAASIISEIYMFWLKLRGASAQQARRGLAMAAFAQLACFVVFLAVQAFGVLKTLRRR